MAMNNQEIDKVNDLYKQLDAKEVEINTLKEQLASSNNHDHSEVLEEVKAVKDLVTKLTK